MIATSATGISTRKAYYSSYAYRYVDVAAPGGDVYDTADNTRDVTKAVLAAAPEAVLRAANLTGPGRVPPVAGRRARLSGGRLRLLPVPPGTSMAAPDAVGVAALIVSRFGSSSGGGCGRSPRVTESVLRLTATRHACPEPRAFTYVRHLPPARRSPRPTPAKARCTTTGSTATAS